MQQPLRPLKRDLDRPIPKFSVCDIEASQWINFLVIGAAHKTYDHEIEDEKKYTHFLHMGEYCDYVFSSEHPYDLVFAHFGGKYDFQFIMKEFFIQRDKYIIHNIIPRGSGMLSFKVSTFKRVHKDDLKAWMTGEYVLGKRGDYTLIKTRTIEFRDSSAILPFGLEFLTANFKVAHKKMKIDYEKIIEVTPDLLEYLEYDCWGLYEVLEVYFNQPIVKEVGGAATSTSQALRIFRGYLDSPISAVTGEIDSFVRKSYFGGRTEIFKPHYKWKDDELLKGYDVNSLYPFIMKTLEMPGGFKKQTQFYLEDEKGFYDVEVTVPEMYIPPLGMRYLGMENRLIFPVGTFRGIWSTDELNYAMTLGVKINRVFNGFIFYNEGLIFKEYIETMYAIRKASEKNSVDDILSKLFMNGTYGRMGLNIYREMLDFFDGTHHGELQMEIPLNDASNVIRLIKTPIVLDTSFANVAIAAWVTSGARIHMHKLIQEAPEDMYYMDTDSLKTTHTYPRNDKDLGQLKLEDTMDAAFYLLPKTYMENSTSPIYQALDKTGKEIPGVKTSKKVVAKGMNKKKTQFFTESDFLTALEGDMSRLRSVNDAKFATFKTAIRHGDFLHLLKEQPRQIKTRYNKRRVFRRQYSQLYDTEPLHIKNGVVTNLDPDILKKWKRPSLENANKIINRVMESWRPPE